MINNFLSLFSRLDELALIMVSLVVYIGICVGSFASRSMDGDSKYKVFFIKLILLVFTLSMMVCADNLIILLISWCTSNIVLVNLMMHKQAWKAAKASGVMAAKNYTLSALFLATAFTILYLATGELSLSAILLHNAQSVSIVFALVLILMAAMTQSALWPFHQWLLSSLNSPTPVSAIMHAGLINGGGFILVRFAPLFLQHQSLLLVMFCVGLISALLGTWWKLLQTDIKRMLACSTMGQMGFMVAQCGLGLFPAAVAHLVWHGMFKAYLFLATGSAAQEKRFDLGYFPTPLTLICALLSGCFGTAAFAYITNKSLLAGDTTLVLLSVAFFGLTQFALSLLQFKTLQKLPLIVISTVCFGAFYGLTVKAIVSIIEPMGIMQPQPLNVFHIFGIIILGLAWIVTLFLKSQNKTINMPSWFLKMYVISLNASQPDPKTITAHRNNYKY